MKKILTLILFLISVCSYSQEQLFTVGVQYKPIFASKFFGAGMVESESDILKASVTPIWGHNYGMMIRRGFTKTLAYEVGINYVKRNYSMMFHDLDSGINAESRFGIVSYEIPNQFLIYIQLGERFFMNNAFGFSLVSFASDVQSKAKENNRFYQVSYINSSFFSLAVIANIGFEYRTEKSGFFYLGASFHKPARDIAHSFVHYEKSNLEHYGTQLPLTGTYLTADLRYFFHAEPIKNQKNKTKKK